MLVFARHVLIFL